MYTYIPDILLLLVSAITCLYCLVLSRRLKKLQSLEGGLGGSIVELTQALASTSEAAKQARLSTEENISVLRTLLHEAQETTPQIEARIESLRYARISAKAAQAELDDVLTSQLKPELQNARNASESLLEIVREVADFKRSTKNNNTRKIKQPSLTKETSLTKDKAA